MTGLENYERFSGGFVVQVLETYWSEVLRRLEIDAVPPY